MEKTTDLYGIIDVMAITGALNNLCADGISRNREVRVACANDYIGKKCLARFDDIKDDAIPTARFITGQVPPNFTAKRQEEYVLVGLWSEKMGRRPSSLEQINKYYDPGMLGFVVYIGDNYTKRQGLITIGKEGVVPHPGTSINQVIKILPDPESAVRLVLTESAKHLGKIITAIEHKRLMPIAMRAMR